MMSEKLRILEDRNRRANLWWDYYKEKYLDAEDKIEKLEEENEQLKDVRENCRNQQVRQANTIHKLLQENEQLRQQIEQLKHFKDLCRKYCECDKIKGLEDE